MNKNWLILGGIICLVFVIQHTSYAQKKKVRYVQDLYFYVKNKIAKEQYYINEYELNSTGKKLPQKGEYKRLERYFYSFSGKSQPKIRMITIRSQKGETLDYEEFLYDLDGQLIFYYEKRNDKKNIYQDISIYFNKGIAVHIIKDKKVLKAEVIDQHEAYLKTAWERGESFHKKFDIQVKRFDR